MFQKLKVQGRSVKSKNQLRLDLATIKSLNTGGTWNENVYTVSGVTITVDEKAGTMTANGTSLSNIQFYLRRNIKLSQNEYHLSGALSQNIRIYAEINGNGTVYIRIANISEVADLKTYLAANPVTVIYELAEPYDLPLTEAENSAFRALRTFDSVTNLSITDDPEFSAEYLKNSENGQAVGDIQEDLQAQIQRIIPYSTAGAHNCIYRGKYLGDSVTAAQWNAIKNGTFDDLYIGDYWVISGIVWRIAAFNYYYNTGDVACDKNHVVIVPDAQLYTHKMNDSNTTEGGYVGSKMYTEGLTQALTMVETAFGAAHILNRREFFCNAVTNGKPSGGAWYDTKIWLMTEMNVYGCKMFGAVSDGSTVPANYTIDKSQYPLFAHEPHIQSNRQYYWLRDVVNNTCFANCDPSGAADFPSTANDLGVRPAFAIYAEDEEETA